MATLARYVVRRIAAPFTMALAVVLLALSLERLLRIVQTVTDQGAPVGQALELLLYLVPHYLNLAVPAAFFLAVLLAVRRLQNGQELAAMQAGGIPLSRLLNPVVAFAAVLTVLLLINTSFVQPHARYAFRARMHELTESTLALRLQPGVFQNLGRNVVVRADDVSRGGKLLEGFFVSMEKPDGSRTVIAARRARIGVNPEGTGLVVTMRDGNIIREGPQTAPGSIDFDEYVWEPPSDTAAAYGPRGHDERELTLPELVAGGAARAVAEARASASAVGAELHGRLVSTLSLPVLAAVAVPLALLGGGRTGRAYGIVVALALLVLYEKIVGMAEAFADDGVLPAWLALWTPFVALLGLTVLLVLHATESAGRSLGAWLARALARPRPPRVQPAAE